MKALLQRDKKRRNLAKKYEQKRLILKFLAYKTNTDSYIQFLARLQLAKLPRNSSITRITNRCILSNRRHGIMRKFKLSRIKLRECILSGKLPGIVKASW